MEYKDYLKLSTLAYFRAFSHVNLAEIDDVYKVSDFVTQYIQSYNDNTPYRTMFNSIYGDDQAANNCVSIKDFIMTDLDLQENGRLGRMKMVYNSYGDERYSSVCLVDEYEEDGQKIRDIYVVLGGNYGGGFYEKDNEVEEKEKNDDSDNISTWEDNFLLGCQITTDEQILIRDFYKKAIGEAKKGLTDETKCNVYVSGHSKAGNLAQFITLVEQNKYYSVDCCYAFDAPGFSSGFIHNFLTIMNPENAKKIRIINPKFSFVGSLLNQIPGALHFCVDTGGHLNPIAYHVPTTLLTDEGNMKKFTTEYSDLSIFFNEISNRLIEIAESNPSIDVEDGLWNLGKAVYYGISYFETKDPEKEKKYEEEAHKAINNPNAFSLLMISIVELDSESSTIRAIAGEFLDEAFRKELDDYSEFNFIKGDGINNYISGTKFKDRIDGTDLHEIISGREGDDFIFGDKGDDSLHGGNGNDRLNGGSGMDYLYGENGNDILNGGTGRDYLYGGSGDDKYIFFKGDGEDEISDTEGINTIILSEYTIEDIVCSLEGNDLRIAQKTSRDTITIRDYESLSLYQNYLVEFANSDIYDIPFLLSLAPDDEGENEDEEEQTDGDGEDGETGEEVKDETVIDRKDDNQKDKKGKIIKDTGGFLDDEDDTDSNEQGIGSQSGDEGDQSGEGVQGNGNGYVGQNGGPGNGTSPGSGVDAGAVAENGIGETNGQFDNSETVRYDPLILDLTKDDYDINKKTSGAYFDLNCDGFAERINWTTTDGILAIDKNGNGKIDDGNEVFSDFFILDNGEKASNGFEALVQYDKNEDGVIDSSDSVFNDLLLWIDSNGNGSVDAGELSRLTDHGISYINTKYEDVNRSTNSEAVIGHESTFGYEDGTESKIGEMWVSSDLYDSMENVAIDITDAVKGLPNVRSFGKVNSLHTAMALDESGELQRLVEQFVEETDRNARKAIVEDILAVLCNTSDIPAKSRGSYINAEHLAVIETVLGKEFNGRGGANPNPNAAAILNKVYEQICDIYYYAMLGSSIGNHLTYIHESVDANGLHTYDIDNFSKYTLFTLECGAIDENEFVDICSYLDYFSMVMKKDHSLYLEFREFISKYADKYIPLVNSAAYGAIFGSASDDTLNGTTSGDLIFGDSGDDDINGGNGEDHLFGEAGTDTIYGGNGNDTLDGGAGYDVLYGGNDNDTYRFGKGYGHDTIDDGRAGSKGDKVVFGDGVSFEDIVISREGDDLILSIKDTEDSLRIKNQYSDYYNRIETFVFTDGTTKTANDIFNTSLTITGEGEIEDFNGGYGTRNTTLIGSDKADTIYGYGGNDTLDGGAGDDVLYGGDDSDTYRFGKGYGHDTIDDGRAGSKSDKVVFGDGVSFEDIVISREGNDFILSIKDTEDSLRIVNQYSDYYNRVEKFEFADGTVAEINLSTSEFTILVKGSDFDKVAEKDTIQENADILSELYNDSIISDDMLLSSGSKSESLADTTAISGNQTSIDSFTDNKVLLLTENMSGLVTEDNIGDKNDFSANDLDNTSNQLLLSTQQ